MRRLRLSIAALGTAATALGLGCATRPALVLDEPVGPVPLPVQSGATQGNLIVYTACDNLETLDPEHRKHTAYTIESEQGTKVRSVRNRAGGFEEQPQVVTLAPGKYWLDAQDANVGGVKVACVVRAGATTVVYLDGTTEPAARWSGSTNWIRQPNGFILGCRDRDSSSAGTAILK